MSRMHADEIDVPADLVRRLLELRFPQWAELPLVDVPSYGTDARLYRLGGEFVVRLPKIHWATSQVEMEQSLLPRLATHLPVAIPEVVAVGEPALGYPWRWAVYRWLDGEPPQTGIVQLARDLTAFIAALQRIDTSDARRGTHRGGPLGLRDAGTRAALAELGDEVDIAAVASAWEAALAVPPWSKESVWLHGDILEGNLLIRDGRLTAVIDWGCACVGDPAFDYAIAWSLLAPVRESFRAATDVDGDTWARARGLALSQALIALPYYLHSSPPIAERSRFIIREVLADKVEHRRRSRMARSSRSAVRKRDKAFEEVEGAEEATGTLLRVAQAALAAYDLPRPLSVQPIRLLNNAVFEVVGEGVHLALRIHRPGYRSIEHIRSELKALEFLADELGDDSPVGTPCPVSARNGALIVCIGDDEQDERLSRRYCDLLTWMDGRVLKHGRGLGRRSAFLLGEGLGRLHNATERLAAADDLDLPQWDAETMFTEESPFQPGRMKDFLAPEAWDVFQGVVDRTRVVFEQLGRGEEQWGMIHADYVLINCHFKRRRDGWQLGVLDFDDLGWGYFLYDLAPLLGNLFDWPDAYGRLRRAFLDGYRSVRSFPAELEGHLPVLMAARHAASLTWLAAKQRRGETDVPIGHHVEIRVSEMQRCLSLNG